MLRPAERAPDIRAMSALPALGDDQQARVGVQRLADQVFADEAPVAVGGIDEADAELRQTPQRPLGFLAVLR